MVNGIYSHQSFTLSPQSAQSPLFALSSFTTKNTKRMKGLEDRRIDYAARHTSFFVSFVLFVLRSSRQLFRRTYRNALLSCAFQVLSAKFAHGHSLALL